ncbi:MAG: sugar phosphate isomerase/epimerase [Bacteroidetes bacterium]|nr:sugar phosphate isomerase/epimerase [Bacteroidota bacterium]
MHSKLTHEYGFTDFVDNTIEAIEYAHSNGLRFLEINFSKKKSPVSALSDEQIILIKNRAFELGITLSFHIPFTENISDIVPFGRNKSIKTLRSFIRVAGKLNANSITIHPGIFYWFPVEKVMREKSLVRLVKGLKELLITCSEENVKIALENLVPIPQGSEFFFLGDNVDDFKFIFKNIQSEFLGLCLDTGHANMAEGVETYIKELGDHILTLHFHDNLKVNDNHMVIGEGNINWELVCERLTELKYTGPLISECRDIEPHKAAQLFEEKFHSK